MEKETFVRLMKCAKESMQDNNYYIAYQYGLRRHFHGIKFGEDRIIGIMRKRGKGFLQGVSDGMAGIPARVYCLKNKCFCKECNLSNYVLDCQNNKIY
jgi:hypothetical protein